VFEGFGVGLTVTELGLDTGPVRPDETVRPSRLSEVLPVSARSDAEIALELGRVQALKAVLAAYEAELVLGLAAYRPDALDPRPGATPSGITRPPGLRDRIEQRALPPPRPEPRAEDDPPPF
jgi:hypothetical protein